MTLMLDVSNIFSDRIGVHGIDQKTLNESIDTLGKYNTDLIMKPYAFMKLPVSRFQFDRMKSLSGTLKTKEIKNLVLLGIGGSALGAETIFNALLNPYHNHDEKIRGKMPRYFIVDNIDPHKINAMIDIIKPELNKTLLVVISKSGETPETISQFMIFKELMIENGGDFQERIILITDKEKGILNKIAKDEGYDTQCARRCCAVFSVLTPVGLFLSIF
jgi:glucose-6-phosphate isomerase